MATGATFAKVASVLTGVLPENNAAGLKIRVHKYTLGGENLYWNNTMSEEEFRTNVYYMIDDPEIDIYPRNKVHRTSRKACACADDVTEP